MVMRESAKKQTIESLSEEVTRAILALDEGVEVSISLLVAEIYSSRGYEFKHIDTRRGYVWTKDGGLTYALRDWDQMEVLEQVTKKLKGQRILDFSKYEGLDVGLPYNLDFTVRKAQKTH